MVIASNRVNADSQTELKLDGQFNDWEQVNKTPVGYYHMGNWALAVSNDSVWLYVDNGGNADMSIPMQNYTLKVADKAYNLEFASSGSQITVTARNMSDNWRSMGEVGTGIISKNGSKQTGEFTLALGKLGLNTTKAKDAEVTLTNSSLGSQTATATDIQSSSTAASSSSASSTTSSSSSSSATSSSSTSSSNNTSATSETAGAQSSSSAQANPNNQSNNLGIAIDGQFNDWTDKPQSPMKIVGDDDNIKNVSLLADGKNVYFYIEMHPVLSGGYVNFQPAGYKLKVGNVVYDIDFNHNTTVNLNDGETKMVTLGIYNAHDNWYTTLNNQVAVTRKKISQKMGDGSTVTGEAYVFECAVPFSALKGSSNMSGQTITLANRNLWTGEVNAAGGSTQPLILAGIGLTIALFAVYKFSGIKSNSWRKVIK
ncbi:hypothetical protein FC81_GL001592 [Liquorilactobacillus capillatus DSM 19910]|uniref:Firmicu-CTERM sorting domain-containing protein n=1 Tax=Liquorilactobacillus capillatus DSM 19910 TaxID=1423731 RepID=A0A0R1LZK8_9LACO|nr:hypothetical protein FC81_GL001592 [Liquorilactobacillus capillatus DSM 19910]